jgi:hypothetical protein
MHSVLSATGHKSVWNGSALSARKCTPQLAHRPAVRGRKPEEGTDALLDVVKLEEAKYASLCVAVINDRSPWMVDDIFDQSMFWAQQKNTLPVHYALWVAEVGCCKVASANVETVFSGAGKISNKSRTLDPQLLSDYAFLHYNYKYDWLRPTLEEIVAAYKKLYGPQARNSDHESDGSSSGGEDKEEEEEEEAEGGGEDEAEGA